MNSFLFLFVKVLPAQPHDIKAEEITNSSIHLSWKRGFGGIYPISLCTVQVPANNTHHEIHNWMKTYVCFKLFSYLMIYHFPFTRLCHICFYKHSKSAYSCFRVAYHISHFERAGMTQACVCLYVTHAPLPEHHPKSPWY